MNNDFKKFINSKNVNSTFATDYFEKITKKNTANILGDNDLPIDVFSKLLDERIIFLSDEIDSEVCNSIKAQLLYL